jgi:hypothetical protein
LPYSSAPADLSVQDGFLGALYCGLSGGRTWDVQRQGWISGAALVAAMEQSEGKNDERKALADGEEKLLREMQHKYSLYLSYLYSDMEFYHGTDLCVDQWCICLTG